MLCHSERSERELRGGVLCARVYPYSIDRAILSITRQPSFCRHFKVTNIPQLSPTFTVSLMVARTNIHRCWNFLSSSTVPHNHRSGVATVGWRCGVQISGSERSSAWFWRLYSKNNRFGTRKRCDTPCGEHTPRHVCGCDWREAVEDNLNG